MSGSAVRSHTWPNKGRRFSSRKKSYLLLSLECREFLVPARLLRRYRRTHQVRLQVQQQSEVTMEHQENWRDTRKTQNKNIKRDNDGAAGNRLRDLPEWSKGLTENLEGTEVPAPAHISHHSDSEQPTKVASRKYSFYTHFPEDRNCEVCKRTKMTRAPCRGRTGEAVPRAVKCGDLITADHKVLNEEGEPRNNHRYAVVVQDLATQWILIRAKNKKYFQETEKSFYESASSRDKSRKSLTLTVQWNLANPVQIYHGIIELLHLMDLRRMVFLDER